ncbi:MAG: hypothetical protein WCF65_07480 [Parachlamydiaceae bacterium]
MQTNHAVAYGYDGQRYVDQTVTFKNGRRQISSEAPKYSALDRISGVAIPNFQPNYFLDCVCTSNAVSKAVISPDWTEFHKNVQKNELNETKKGELSIRTVDVFGIFESGIRKFIFRKVEGEDAKVVQEELDKDVPSIDKLNARVYEAINLTQFPYSGGRAAWKFFNPIAFYYLPVGKQLEVTIEEGISINVKPLVRPLIFAYPVYPDVTKEKLRITIDLLKQEFKKFIDVFSINEHPIEINEPPTIREVCPSDFS